MQEGVAELPAYGADDMTFVQEEEVFPVLPDVIPSLIPGEQEVDDEKDADVKVQKSDLKPGGKRKAAEGEGVPKKVLLLFH